MAFNGSEGGPITIDVAETLTANYRAQNPTGTKGHFMGKNILQQILNQQGCMGIRVYYGLDANGNRELVFVGADAGEGDMENGIIGDLSKPCPHMCKGSRLNGG